MDFYSAKILSLTFFLIGTLYTQAWFKIIFGLTQIFEDLKVCCKFSHIFKVHTANEGSVRESNINVWFWFMYSQKWNWAASLFPKQNYNVLSSNFLIHDLSVSDLYIPRIGLSILLQIGTQIWSWEYTNCSQIRECMKWEQGRAVSFLGIKKSDFRYSAFMSQNKRGPPQCETLLIRWERRF